MNQIVKSSAKNVRISSEKVNLVVAQIKKMSPVGATNILNFVTKSSSPVLKKVVASAIANAKNNFHLDENSLVFKELYVTKGPMYKRFQPVSRGRAHTIFKRTSHINVILEGKPMPKPEATKAVTQDKKETKEVTNGTKS